MAKPKLALIPSTVGGSVYSVLPSNGDGDFNFSRASAATRINAQGLIETVAVGDNRLNYPLLDGTVQTCPHLLLEGQRTNLITYSEQFDNAAWTKNVSVTANAITSPDGTLNADKINEDAAIISQWIHQNFTLTGTYNFSVFAKKGERDYIALFNQGSDATYFNLANGTIVSTAVGVTSKIENYGNGWYRCIITTTTNPSIYSIIAISDNGSRFNYAGDITKGIYIYGAQLEAGSYSTSYIVSNSGSATTRIAEVCNGSGNASTFNDSEGVLMVQIGALADDATDRIITISDGTNSNRVTIYYEVSTNSIGYNIVVGGGSVANNQEVVTDRTSFSKIGVKYKTNDFAFWIDGFELSTDSNGITFGAGILTELSFYGAGANFFYGKTKQLQYFDSALTDSELETLTSWMSFSDMAIDLNYTIQ